MRKSAENFSPTSWTSFRLGWASPFRNVSKFHFARFDLIFSLQLCSEQFSRNEQLVNQLLSGGGVVLLRRKIRRTENHSGRDLVYFMTACEVDFFGGGNFAREKNPSCF